MRDAERWSAAEHEMGIVRGFCAKERRDRYTNLLGSGKGRAKFLNALYHNIELEESVIVRLPGKMHTAAAIEAELRKRGGGENCYCVSTCRELDGNFVQLAEALKALIGSGDGTILSLIPGHIGFYEPEEPKRRFILDAGIK